jgi:hypothetical protein
MLVIYNGMGAADRRLGVHGGASGVWKDRLDDAAPEMVMTDHGEWLAENGYLSDPPDDEDA